MFNMAFQVVFSAKNVPRFSFGLLVAPKLKKRGGHNGPPPGLNVFPKAGSDRVKHKYLFLICLQSSFKGELLSIVMNCAAFFANIEFT